MITLNFTNTKSRAKSHVVFATVAEDVHMFNKILNQKRGVDLPLPCPEKTKEQLEGIANSSELWFGEQHKLGSVNVNVMKKSSQKFFAKDEHLRLLFQLTVLSLCEQFVYCKFATNEDFSKAVYFYEECLGSISDNSCRALGLKERV